MENRSQKKFLSIGLDYWEV